ncbi:MAG: ABC transporter substrate-binding protein, partial [Planctomycetota bacterium]
PEIKTVDRSTLFHIITRPLLMLVGLGLLVADSGWAQQPANPQNANPQNAKAQDSGPQIALIDREPFDRMKLDEFNKSKVYDIIPLANPPSRPLPETGELIFEPISGDWQGELLVVGWEHVVEYETFNMLLLKEADELIQQKNFSEAYRHILYVYDNGNSGDREIIKKLRTVMYKDANDNFDKGNYDLALTILEDIYKREPNFIVPGSNRRLVDMITECYDKSIPPLVESGAFKAVQSLLNTLKESYGESAVALAEKWNTELSRLHVEAMEQARAAEASGDLLKARQLAQRALSILPTDNSSVDFINNLIAKRPFVVVGVTQAAANPNPDRLEHWASRRVGRLTERRLVEFVGLADEGGKYEFVPGRVFAKDETGLVYRFVIEPQKLGFAIPRLNAYQLASQLLDYADADNPRCVIPWAKNLESVTVVDDYTVDVQLKIPLVRPEAYLSLPFRDDVSELTQTGAYVIEKQSDRMVEFEANSRYLSRKTSEEQLPGIAELLFANQSDAADALLRGEIDVLDRVSPNDLSRLRRDPEVEVRSYLIPTVHMLVPNRRNEFMQDNLFRNGLMKSINRQLILNGLAGRGMEIDGTEVLNGPFPLGMENLDQIAYAYNTRIPLIPFNQQMGNALIETSRQARIAMALKKLPPEEANKPGAAPDIKFPEIVIAHPEGDVPSVACAAIAQSWKEIGLKVTVRRLPPGVTLPADEDYDFLYVEIMMAEPLADAEFLFGKKGLVKQTNAAIEQITRDSSISTSWRTASNSLRNLHRQVNNDMSVLPLWQMREFYAHRRNVRNVGRELIFIYQNIERWRIEPLQLGEIQP